MPGDRIFTFGDSLFDTGNSWIESKGLIPPIILYPHHRFSNDGSLGDYLGIHCKKQVVNSEALDSLDSVSEDDFLVNFSIGGASAESTGVANSIGQSCGINYMIDKYEWLAKRSGKSAHLRASDLVILEVGNNDVILIAKLTDPEKQKEAIKQYGINMADAVQRLYDLGMRRLAVFDIAPAQLSPESQSLPKEQRDALEALVAALNASLCTQVSALVQKLDKLNFLIVPYNNIITMMSTRPTEFGLTNIRDAFIESPYFCNYPSTHDVLGYAFWDQQHPTSSGIEAVMPLLTKYLCLCPPEHAPNVKLVSSECQSKKNKWCHCFSGFCI